jgi:PspA-Associated protein
VIVRIMTEDQYRLPDEQLSAVQRLDDDLEKALDSGDDESFRTALSQLIAFVRAHGEAVAIEEVVPSDLMIPAPDMSLAEAKSRLHPEPAVRPATE